MADKRENNKGTKGNKGGRPSKANELKLIEKMDKISRLNLNRATDISETRSTHTRMDVAKVMETLDTPEKKRDFLRKQLTFKNDDRNKKDIGNTTAASTS